MPPLCQAPVCSISVQARLCWTAVAVLCTRRKRCNTLPGQLVVEHAAVHHEQTKHVSMRSFNRCVCMYTLSSLDSKPANMACTQQLWVTFFRHTATHIHRTLSLGKDVSR